MKQYNGLMKQSNGLMNQEQLEALLQILWEGYDRCDTYDVVINIRALIDALEALQHGEEYIFYENISALDIKEIEDETN